MACSWSIKCFPQTNMSRESALDLIEESINLINSFEQYFTIFMDSPFNDINKYAGVRPVNVSEECIDLVEEAINYYELTKSSFNIAYRSKEGFKDITKVIINKEESTIYLPHKEMIISLGGIGKGAAVDKAFHFLKSKGLINFIINGSGDIRTHSHMNAPRPWKIGIQNPFNVKNNIGNIQLKNESIATSGQYLKKNHIKHSNTNTPLSVSVIGMNVTNCDVWATYLSTLEVEEAVEVANKNDIFSILISKSGKVLHTKKSIQSIQRAEL